LVDHAPLELERFLPYRLSILSNRVSQAIAREYTERFNLSMTEWRVMAVLARFNGEGMSAREVAERTAMDKVAVSRALARLTSAGATWINAKGGESPIVGSNILVVAPYNAQVTRLTERLGSTGARVGTVDKFQGKEAPIVIYSMATSRPEDAPRGMEFLYSLNRLNVATSRAKCLAVLVASPRLLEPECRSPRQMQLANGLCRFRELATIMAASRPSPS